MRQQDHRPDTCCCEKCGTHGLLRAS